MLEDAQEKRDNTTAASDAAETETPKQPNADKQAYAEGARKAEKKLIESLGFGSIDDLKAALDDKSNDDKGEAAPEPDDDAKTDGEEGHEAPAEGEKAGNVEEMTARKADELDTREAIKSLKAEVELLKADKIAKDAGVTDDHSEDLVALVRGKGLALTEANIKTEAERHPEWRGKATAGLSIGASTGSEHQDTETEEDLAERLAGWKI